jgi:hypothetical protein
MYSHRRKWLTDEKRGNSYSSAHTSFSSCLDQAWNILFPNIFLKKKEEISWSEENFHLCLHPPFRFVYFCFERMLEIL